MVMRVRTQLMALLAAGVLAGCGGYSPTSPTSPGTGGNGGYGGGTGGNGGNGGSGGGSGDNGGGPSPMTAAVDLGNDFFHSGHNGTRNPAVDSVAVGGTVTWTWGNTGTVSHSVKSEGSSGFTSSAIQSGAGSTHQVTFTTAGVYHYDCAVHGAAMSGTIVVR
jgi:plastocyanin